MTSPSPPHLDYRGSPPKLPDTRPYSTASVFSAVATVIAVVFMSPLLCGFQLYSFYLFLPCAIGLALPVALACGIYGIVTTSRHRRQLRGARLAWSCTSLAVAMIIAGIAAESYSQSNTNCLAYIAPLAGLTAFLRRPL